MDDVNDMDESRDTVERWLGPQGRREFLMKAAAAGAIAWAAPVILSRPAYADEGGGGTKKCRPSITKNECRMISCDAGQKNFPGFTLNPIPCPCSPTMPPQPAFTCIKIAPKPPATTISIGSQDLMAFGNGTDCSPGNCATDVIFFSTNPGRPAPSVWRCFDASMPVFFGMERNGSPASCPSGAISAVPTGDFEFLLGVWAGNCPDKTGTTHAFNCQTFDVAIHWDQGKKQATCTKFDPVTDPMQSLCTGTTSMPPCTCP